jgi:hypothetical protein
MDYIIYVVNYQNFTNDTQTIELFGSADEAREFIHKTCRSFFTITTSAHTEDLQDALEQLNIAQFTIELKAINLPTE